MIKISWFVLLFLFFFVLPAYSADYYVDPQKGSDGNNGSIGAPWKTIDRAKRSSGTVQPGDTVYIKDTITYAASIGVQFSSGDSGSSGSPITYKAWSGQAAILKGDYTSCDQIVALNNGVHHLVFDGLTFTTTATLPLRQANMPYLTDAIHFNDGDDITIQNCSFTIIGMGIATSENGLIHKNIIVDNNKFDALWQDPMYLANYDGVYFRRNIVSRTAIGFKINPHKSGSYVNNVEVSGNFFYQNGYGIISGGTSWTPTNSGEGVVVTQMGGYPVTNIKIFNNIFWGNCKWAVKVSVVNNVEIYNNTIYRQGNYNPSIFIYEGSFGGSISGIGVRLESADSTVVKNNIIANNIGSAIYESSSATNTIQSSNITSGRGGPDFDFVNGDPESTDPTNPQNYRLSAKSPGAIDKGMDLRTRGVIIDYFGNSRPINSNCDIGSHEYGSGANNNGSPAAPQALRIVQQ